MEVVDSTHEGTKWVQSISVTSRENGLENCVIFPTILSHFPKAVLNNLPKDMDVAINCLPGMVVGCRTFALRTFV